MINAPTRPVFQSAASLTLLSGRWPRAEQDLSPQREEGWPARHSLSDGGGEGAFSESFIRYLERCELFRVLVRMRPPRL